MKNIAIIFTCFLILKGIEVNAQNKLLDGEIVFDTEKLPFSELRKSVEEQLSVSFVYHSKLLRSDKVISLPSKKISLERLLNHIAAIENLKYVIKKKTVILTAKTLNRKTGFSGYIKDADTGEVLIGANIYVPELGAGIVSNSYGFYSIPVTEQGDYTVEVSFVGYKPTKLTMSAGLQETQDFELTQETQQLGEVVIQSDVEDEIAESEIGVSSLGPGKIKKMPALAGEPDLLQVVRSLPGVTTVGEGAGGFNVRGGGIDQNLILLDEAPIYNASHLFGFFSIFNADVVKSATLYKGIPARFGGRASSVLDIYQKEGSNQFGGSFSLGGIVKRLMFEGPIVKDKASFIIAGRALNPLVSALGSGLAGPGSGYFGFYDLNAKLNYQLSAKDKLFLSGYFGDDQYSLVQNDLINSDFNNSLDWSNQSVSMRWNRIFNPVLFSNFTALYSRYRYKFSEIQSGQAGNWEAAISNYTVKADFNYFPSATTSFEFGAQLNYILVNPGEVNGNIGYFNISEGIRKAPQKALENSIYASVEYKLTEEVTIQAGARYTLYGYIGDTAVTTYLPNEPLSVDSQTGIQRFGQNEWVQTYGGIEPRLLLNYQLSKRWVAKFNYQRLYQYVQLISNTTSTLPIDIWKLSDVFIEPLRSDMISAGLFWANNDLGLIVSAEGYYKKLDDFIDYKNGADLFANENLETELLSGDGRNYGVELAVNKQSKRLTVDLSYTFSRSIRNVNGRFREEKINSGLDYPSNFDQPHNLNLSIIWKLTDAWTLSSQFVYRSGRPITLPSERFILDRIEVDLSEDRSSDIFYKSPVIYNVNERNNFRLPDFHRLDISLFNRKETKRKNIREWSFGVYNAYGRKNAFALSFNNAATDETSLRVQAQKISIIGIPVPFVSYSLKF